MNAYLESCDVFDQNVFWIVLRCRQGREDDSDKVQETCGAGIGLALCIWVEDCIRLA